MKKAFVYILASQPNGTLYVGVTSDLMKRIYEHKNDLADGFSKKYAVHNLVHYEIFDDMYNAIRREKLLKTWKRKWKIDLIKKDNPEWRDLYEEIV